MAHIGDIIISRNMFDGDRFRTAQLLATTIDDHEAKLNINRFISTIKTIDIPTSTNKFDATCLGFMRLADSRDHQTFVDKFNSRIEFKGKYLIMRLSQEHPKGRCAN